VKKEKRKACLGDSVNPNFEAGDAVIQVKGHVDTMRRHCAAGDPVDRLGEI
jgi:hypothetical protein